MPETPAPTPPSAEFLTRVTGAQRSLYAFLLTLVRQSADAEDVLQETNVVLWQKAAEFDSSREFMPWALRIAQLQAMAHLKKQKRVPVTFDEPLLAVLAEEAMAEARELAARREALASCLRKLPNRHRELIGNRYEPGGSVNEMASQLGKTPKAVSEMLRRIRRALLECIERKLAQEART
ncbi:sigma-70 family RNA polymerase sigma factor [Candidatus Uhrbacteria bacterium]|nr:sigma-70 family RNA polymerase sigma factor [Candidatus Uhrbacteria bacterium]